MKILCIGEALIDMICTDKGKLLSDSRNFISKPGGAPANVAAAIAALGGQVELAAKVGNDPFGRKLIQVMQHFGVSDTWIIPDNNFFTSFAFVSLTEDGERDFVFNRGADGQLSTTEVDAIPLNNSTIIHFGSATAFLPGPLQKTYLHMLNKSKQYNCFISFDPNYRHLLFKEDFHSFIEQSWHFIKSSHFIKLSSEEAFLITGCENVTDAANLLLKNTKAVFTITMGKEGTLLGIHNNVYRIPSIPVQVVDSTGAGDAFTGALLYQLSLKSIEEIISLASENWKSIVTHANKAGALTCQYIGAMEAFTHLSKNTLF